MYSSEYYKIFNNTYFEFWRTSRNGCLCTSNHKVSHKYWASFINQKNDMGWFLLRSFVDLVRLYSLLIISKNHSNTFLLLDLQKNRNKVKNRSSDVMILTSFKTSCCPLINVYFNDMQLIRWQNFFSEIRAASFLRICFWFFR